MRLLIAALALLAGHPAVAEESLEAQTLARMEELERNMRELRLDHATAERLIREGKEQLLKSYCLRSQLSEQGE